MNRKQLYYEVANKIETCQLPQIIGKMFDIAVKTDDNTYHLQGCCANGAILVDRLNSNLLFHLGIHNRSIIWGDSKVFHEVLSNGDSMIAIIKAADDDLFHFMTDSVPNSEKDIFRVCVPFIEEYDKFASQQRLSMVQLIANMNDGNHIKGNQMYNFKQVASILRAVGNSLPDIATT